MTNVRRAGIVRAPDFSNERGAQTSRRVLLVVAQLALESALGLGGESPAGLAGHAGDDLHVTGVRALAALHGGVHATNGRDGLLVGSQRSHLNLDAGTGRNERRRS